MAAAVSWDGENPGKQHHVPKFLDFFLFQEKNSISTFSPFAPLFWEGGGSENLMELPPKFSSGEKNPGNSSSPNLPPKILGNDPELLFASRNPSQKVRTLLGYFQLGLNIQEWNSWGFVGSNFQEYFHAELARIQREFPDPTETPAAFKILSPTLFFLVKSSAWKDLGILEYFFQ